MGIKLIRVHKALIVGNKKDSPTQLLTKHRMTVLSSIIVYEFYEHNSTLLFSVKYPWGKNSASLLQLETEAQTRYLNIHKDHECYNKCFWDLTKYFGGFHCMYITTKSKYNFFHSDSEECYLLPSFLIQNEDNLPSNIPQLLNNSYAK